VALWSAEEGGGRGVEVSLLAFLFSFVVCLLRCQCLWLYTVDGRIFDDLEITRKSSFCKRATILVFSWRDWRTSRNMSGGVFGIAVEI
jgi:hypothetical protein